MDKRLKDLLVIHQCVRLGVTVVAGYEGLDNRVRGVAVLELPELIDQDNKQELLIMTGAAIEEKALLGYVKAAHKHQTSGVILAMGPRIPQVPDEVIQYGDNEKFPILTIQKMRSISPLIYVFGKELFGSEEEDYIDKMEIHIRNLILDQAPPVEERDRDPYLKQLYSKTEAEFITIFCCIAEAENEQGARGGEKPVIEEIRLALKTHLDDYFKQLFLEDAYALEMPDGVAVVLNGSYLELPNSSILMEIASTLTDHAEKCDSIRIRIGISNVHRGIESLGKSYKEATLAVRVADIRNLDTLISEYRRLGTYRVIGNIGDLEEMIKFSNEMMEPILTYDALKEGDLLQFLTAYFEHNGNVKNISKNLFLHKNTALYKIKKIESILKMSFINQDELFSLKLALDIYSLYNGSDKLTGI